MDRSTQHGPVPRVPGGGSHTTGPERNTLTRAERHRPAASAEVKSPRRTSRAATSVTTRRGASLQHGAGTSIR